MIVQEEKLKNQALIINIINSIDFHLNSIFSLSIFPRKNKEEFNHILNTCKLRADSLLIDLQKIQEDYPSPFVTHAPLDVFVLFNTAYQLLYKLYSRIRENQNLF